jgi:hypothetical protein
MSGYKLNYTFLGQKNETSIGQYTPLIIPKIPSAKPEPNFKAQQGQQIPASRIGSDQIGIFEKKDEAVQMGVTPFSRIRNYYFDKIANNNFTNMQTELIDMVKNFIWTISPQTAKTGTSDYEEASADRNRKIADEVPYIQIKEKYFLVNNLVAQALYSLTAGNNLGVAQTGKTVWENLQGAGSFVGGVAGDAASAAANTDTFRFFSEQAQNIAEFTAPLADAAGNAVEQNIIGPLQQTQTAQQIRESELIQSTQSILTSLGGKTQALFEALKNYQDPDLEPVLFPYQRLYFVGPTGFEYKIPYLSPNAFSINNQFGVDAKGRIPGVGGLLDEMQNIAEGIQNFANLGVQAGSTYIERTQYYQYPKTDSPIEVKIPLYNTKPATYQDVCNNFKLVFLLLYQNSALKQDKLVVEPPCIYDVKIPGMKRQPYCYLQNMTVMHQGNTRIMDIDISDLEYAAGGQDLLPNSTVKAIVPDAYLIQLTFQPMLTQTKNMLFTTISDHDTVIATET